MPACARCGSSYTEGARYCAVCSADLQDKRWVVKAAPIDTSASSADIARAFRDLFAGIGAATARPAIFAIPIGVAIINVIFIAIAYNSWPGSLGGGAGQQAFHLHMWIERAMAW